MVTWQARVLHARPSRSAQELALAVGELVVVTKCATLPATDADTSCLWLLLLLLQCMHAKLLE